MSVKRFQTQTTGKFGRQLLLDSTISNVLLGRDSEKALNECLGVSNVCPLPHLSKWYCLASFARLDGNVALFLHRETRWGASPLHPKQRNRCGLSNWQNCLSGVRQILFFVDLYIFKARGYREKWTPSFTQTVSLARQAWPGLKLTNLLAQTVYIFLHISCNILGSLLMATF